jgi:hypothetical protein
VAWVTYLDPMRSEQSLVCRAYVYQSRESFFATSTHCLLTSVLASQVRDCLFVYCARFVIATSTHCLLTSVLASQECIGG